MIEIATTTTGLRKQARELGIKGMGSANKATLLPLVTAEVTRRNAEELAAAKAEAEKAASEAKPAPAKKADKGCRSCGVRNVGTGSGDSTDRDAARAVELCVPCHEEAQWENAHSDHGHDALPEDAAERAGCWICYPELNRASADYKGRYGTSRAGMKVNVTRKMTSRQKAELVAQQLTAFKISEQRDGGVTLTGECPTGPVELRFTAKTFDHKNSRVGGKKVLNVAAALRRIAEAG
ncbi:hypothetical protein ML5_0880 [Micromonospora sp. L5]|uniref:hypothetical protein n=1 Tax=Micromonospora sp. (strain L5) TaxID=648999 RepID=UPI0001C45CA0|nr:hypothetical protein [Micromonospora sp. L5]ADU06422.1 hypothetical protein ML5_0880 [Micromonospora sp. L5]